MEKPVIEKGIPIPPSHRRSIRSVWREMEVGDSVVYDWTRGAIGRAASWNAEAKSLRWRFQSRQVMENGVKVVRIWRVK